MLVLWERKDTTNRPRLYAGWQHAWPGRSLRSISKKDVVTFIETALKRGPSAGVTAWKVAKAFFAWCEAREDDFASPARSIRKPAKEQSRDRVLNDAELKLVWDAGEAEGGPAGALVNLLVLSGARRNEVTELAREEIGADAIELSGGRTKNGLPHTSPLTPMIRRVLNSLPTGGKFVLNGTDRPFGDQPNRRRRFFTWPFSPRMQQTRRDAQLLSSITEGRVLPRCSCS
jgi:integrase